MKMFRQVKAPLGHVKERAYPKQVNQEGDVQRYGGLKAIKKDETIFAAYVKAEMKAKIMIVANSDFIYTSKSLFWPDVIMLTAVELDLTQSVSMTIGVQRQTDMNPITLVFAGINDHLPDGLKFVYAIVALFSEGKYDVIIYARNCEIEMENLRPLRSELPAVWSDISNAMIGV